MDGRIGSGSSLREMGLYDDMMMLFFRFVTLSTILCLAPACYVTHSISRYGYCTRADKRTEAGLDKQSTKSEMYVSRRTMIYAITTVSRFMLHLLYPLPQ